MANNKIKQLTDEEKRFRIKAGLFLTAVGGMAALTGFSKTLSTAKREEQKLLEKGAIETVHLLDAGSALAMRALGWGTLYAVIGTGSICYAIWKLSGAKNMTEFRYKMGSALPRLTNSEPKSRTEFEGLTDLMEYLSTWKGTKS